MKSDKIFKTVILLIAICNLFFQSSCCDEKAGFQIVRGNVTEAECLAKLERTGVDITDPPNISIICPDEPCTICYGKKNVDKIRIVTDDGSIDVFKSNDSGAIPFTPSKTTQITLEPQNSCANAKSTKVYVLTDALDIPITGKWDHNLGGQNNCSNVVFSLSETFVSPNIFAIEIMANWDDATIIESYHAYESPCPIPPFLSVFRPGDIAKGSHTISLPKQWKKLPRQWEAVGNWAFVPEYIEKCYARKNCDLRIDFPFFVYMSCDSEEPYRQP